MADGGCRRRENVQVRLWVRKKVESSSGQNSFFHHLPKPKAEPGRARGLCFVTKCVDLQDASSLMHCARIPCSCFALALFAMARVREGLHVQSPYLSLGHT